MAFGGEIGLSPSHGAAMLSVMLACAFVSRQFWGAFAARFGGLRTVPDAGQVVDVNFNPIPGLYCAGEMVGGIFYFNYPSGTGLVSGAVFGRIAGASAGRAAAELAQNASAHAD